MLIDTATEISTDQMRMNLSHEGRDQLTLAPYSDDFLDRPMPFGRVSAAEIHPNRRTLALNVLLLTGGEEACGRRVS